ncbi:MAG: hypothetical protein U0350_20285 [Caldilineaceae bacterium]
MEKLLSREEVLGGLQGRSVKRAHTTLALIKNRTAWLVAQSEPPIGLILAENTLKARNQAFLEALVQDRDQETATPIQPPIQAIERYAPQWSALVPVDVNSRATIAHLLSQEYRFTQNAAPQLRLALGLDSAEVQQAYQRLYQQPLSTIYAPRPTLVEQGRWAWATLARRLEGLPPFWLAFTLTLPGAAGLLALPIALAQVGLVTGLLLLVLFGLLNWFTIGALAETVARSGTMRFGLGFLGQLMQEYTGNVGSLLMTVVLALNNFLVLPIFYIGVAGTLADATALPTALWIAVLFGVTLYFLSRQSLNATIATTLLIVFVNIVVLILIPLLALPHFRSANFSLGALPWTAGHTLSAATWALVIGILASTYFSHPLIATYGSVVLRRDPSARTWQQGSMAAILFHIVICCIWLIVLNGVIPASVLANAPGTVLVPLAAQVGAIVRLLGAWLVTFSMGLVAVQIALALYYLVQERLPRQINASAQGEPHPKGARRWVRFWLGVSPVIVVFLLSEWVAWTGFGTFTSLLSVLGVLLLPLLSGVFPVLLILAIRRKGDFSPSLVYRFLGNPWLVGLVYSFFLGIILLHGLVLWENPVARLTALLITLIVLGATVVMLRREALQPRMIVEVRKEAAERGLVRVMIGDEPVTTPTRLTYANGEQQVQVIGTTAIPFAALRSIQLQIPPTHAKTLKVWIHQLSPEGDVNGLPARLAIEESGKQQAVDLQPVSGPPVLALTGAAYQLTVTLQPI